MAGCSNVPLAVRDEPVAQATGAAVRPTVAAIGARLASSALDDRQLSGARGGLSTGSGMIMTFSFQEATYVNHNLIQSVVVPTITVSPGSFTGAATMAGALASIGNATSVPAISSTSALQSILNDGMTSVASNLSGRGITSAVSNAANNQLVQQLITANIGISGLAQTLRQSVPAMVTPRLAGANSAFR